MADQEAKKSGDSAHATQEDVLRATIQMRIREVLGQSSLSMRELAQRSGVKLGTLHALLNDGSSSLSLLRVLPIMHALGLDTVTVGDLLGDRSFESRQPTGEAEVADLLLSEEEARKVLDELFVTQETFDAEYQNLLNEEQGLREELGRVEKLLERQLIDVKLSSVDLDVVHTLMTIKDYAPTRDEYDGTRCKWRLDINGQYKEVFRRIGFGAQGDFDDEWTPRKIFSIAQDRGRESRLPVLLAVSVLEASHPRTVHSYFNMTRYDTFEDVPALDVYLRRVESVLHDGGPKEAMTLLLTKRGIGPSLSATFLYYLAHGNDSINPVPVKLDAVVQHALRWLGLVDFSSISTPREYEKCLEAMGALSRYTGVEPDLLDAALYLYRMQGEFL